MNQFLDILGAKRDNNLNTYKIFYMLTLHCVPRAHTPSNTYCGRGILYKRFMSCAYIRHICNNIIIYILICCTIKIYFLLTKIVVSNHSLNIILLRRDEKITKAFMINLPTKENGS